MQKILKCVINRNVFCETIEERGNAQNDSHKSNQNMRKRNRF